MTTHYDTTNPQDTAAPAEESLAVTRLIDALKGYNCRTPEAVKSFVYELADAFRSGEAAPAVDALGNAMIIMRDIDRSKRPFSGRELAKVAEYQKYSDKLRAMDKQILATEAIQ